MKNLHIKGTLTVHFSSSLYIINQKPMIARTDFHCITTWVAMLLLILWFVSISHMALLFNINIYFDCKAILCLMVSGRHGKVYYYTRKFLSTRYTL